MTTVEIEYCVPCGLQEHAVDVQRRLLEAYGQDLEGVRLTPGHGGVFRVYADGDLLWDKDDRGGIDPAAIVEAVESD